MGQPDDLWHFNHSYFTFLQLEDLRMTDRQYLRHLLKLTIKISDVCDTDGYGSDAYNAVLKEISDSALKFNRSRSRRRRPWLRIALVVFLLCILAWLFYEFFCLSKI